MQSPSTTPALKPLTLHTSLFSQRYTLKHHHSSLSPSSNCQKKQHSPNNYHYACCMHSSGIPCQSIQQETYSNSHPKAPHLRDCSTQLTLPPLLRVNIVNPQTWFPDFPLLPTTRGWNCLRTHDILEVMGTQANSKSWAQSIRGPHWINFSPPSPAAAAEKQQPQNPSFNHSFVHSPQSSNKRLNWGGESGEKYCN